MFKKLQLKLLFWIVKKKKQRDSKPHRQLNQCNDCSSVMYPLYQVSILNIGAYVVAGSIITIAWNVLLGITIAIGSILFNFFVAKPECRSCRSYDIELYKEIEPTKIQRKVNELDSSIAKVDEEKVTEEDKTFKDINHELKQLEDEIEKVISDSKNREDE